MGGAKVPAVRRGIVEVEPAFQATAMDPAVLATVEALTQAADLWKKLHPKVEKYLEHFDPEGPLEKGETEAGRASQLVSTLERLSRVSANLIKVVDEASRLRSFLTGGADSRPDLDGLSDPELVDLLVNVALTRGLWRIIRKKGIEAGIIDVEAVPELETTSKQDKS